MEFLGQFNSTIREFATRRGLLHIDLAAAFAPLDRPRLMRDFAHFTDAGYRCMALMIADHLVRAGWIEGDPPADFDVCRNPSPTIRGTIKDDSPAALDELQRH